MSSSSHFVVKLFWGMYLLAFCPFASVEGAILLEPGVIGSTEALSMIFELNSSSPPDGNSLIKIIKGHFTLTTGMANIFLLSLPISRSPIYFTILHIIYYIYIISHTTDNPTNPNITIMNSSYKTKQNKTKLSLSWYYMNKI